MKRRSVIEMIFPWIMLLAVASCGTTTDYADGGIGGTGISVGKITAFGRVWVNGIEYSTTGAVISIEGIESVSDGSLEFDRSLLDEGKIVTVHWANDANGNPVAERIVFEDNLEGSVTSIDSASQTFEVLGQTVKINGLTVFEDSVNGGKIAGDIAAILGEIVPGNMIEVSGFVDTDGTIQATYIELKLSEFTPGVTEVEIKGVIGNIDTPVPGTFTMGNLTVDYNSAYELPPGGLSNDLYVEVKGTLDESGLVLSADKIEVEEDIFENSSGMRIEIEGIVTSPVDVNGRFEVNMRSGILITTTTQFENGVTATDILPGVEIEVEGTVGESGALNADKIEIKSGDDGNDDSGEESGDDSDDDSSDDSDNGSGDNVL